MPSTPRLDASQELAVTAPDGAVLVYAGAGSGKTRVLTSRIAWLLERDVPAADIMAFTFTRRAADDMRRRLRRMLPAGTDLADLRLGTFHSLMAQALRREGEEVLAGVERNRRFTVWDEEDRAAVVSRLLKAGDYAEDTKASEVAARIGRWKNDGLAPEEVEEKGSTDALGIVAARIWPTYEDAAVEANAFDLEDLLLVPVRLLQIHSTLRERWAGSVRHLLLEEAQELNPVQAELVDLLNSVHGNIFAVGDDAQGIEGARGAQLEHLREFAKRHPGAREFRLATNYRSNGAIATLAHSVLHHGKPSETLDLAVDSMTPAGTKPVFKRFPSEQAEARFLAAEIRRLAAGGTPRRDIAILVRDQVQIPALEGALSENGLDYHVLGGAAYWDRKETRDAVAWLRLVLNPRDEVAAKRALSAPGGRGIGEVLIGEVTAVRGDDDWVAAMATVAAGAAGTTKGRASLRAMVTLLTGWTSGLATMALQDLVREVIEESGLLDAVDDGTDEGETSYANLQDLMALAASYKPGALAELLDAAILDDEAPVQGPAEMVTIATIRAAKGLEWKAIFLAGCEEGLLPHTDIGTPNLEEERRLFYVGVTRAKQRLVLTAAAGRLLDGDRGLREISRFVRESAAALSQPDEGKHLDRHQIHRSMATRPGADSPRTS